MSTNMSKDKKANKFEGYSKMYPELKNVPLYLNKNLEKPCELDTEITDDGFTRNSGFIGNNILLSLNKTIAGKFCGIDEVSSSVYNEVNTVLELNNSLTPVGYGTYFQNYPTGCFKTPFSGKNNTNCGMGNGCAECQHTQVLLFKTYKGIPVTRNGKLQTEEHYGDVIYQKRLSDSAYKSLVAQLGTHPLHSFILSLVMDQVKLFRDEDGEESFETTSPKYLSEEVSPSHLLFCFLLSRTINIDYETGVYTKGNAAGVKYLKFTSINFIDKLKYNEQNDIINMDILKIKLEDAVKNFIDTLKFKRSDYLKTQEKK